MDLSKFIFEQSIVNVRDIKNLSSQQYRAWSDCTDVQAGQTQNWFQSSLLFGVNTNYYLHIIV